MKITLITNQELVIQARNEKDFEQAHKVAQKISEHYGEMADVCGECKHELWVHICFIDMPYQAKDIRDVYNVIKKEIK